MPSFSGALPSHLGRPALFGTGIRDYKRSKSGRAHGSSCYGLTFDLLARLDGSDGQHLRRSAGMHRLLE